MDVELKRASLNDAGTIFKMQIKAFKDLLSKYEDYDTNPGNEPLEKVVERLNQDYTYFYLIYADGVLAGAVRVVDFKDERAKKISPLFILKEYRNCGIAQKAILLAEKIHGESNWELETILQEKGNCYLYEKAGYHTTGRTEKINDKLTLVFYHK